MIRITNFKTLNARKDNSLYKANNRFTEQGHIKLPIMCFGNDSNKARIYKLTEMDADHVTAWSNGGATDINNCTMLCKTHNRAKGNK